MIVKIQLKLSLIKSIQQEVRYVVEFLVRFILKGSHLKDSFKFIHCFSDSQIMQFMNVSSTTINYVAIEARPWHGLQHLLYPIIYYYLPHFYLGGIQQLCGPNVTQFSPPTQMKKQTFSILSSLCHVTHSGLSTNPPPPSFYPRSY